METYFRARESTPAKTFCCLLWEGGVASGPNVSSIQHLLDACGRPRRTYRTERFDYRRSICILCPWHLVPKSVTTSMRRNGQRVWSRVLAPSGSVTSNNQKEGGSFFLRLLGVYAILMVRYKGGGRLYAMSLVRLRWTICRLLRVRITCRWSPKGLTWHYGRGGDFFPQLWNGVWK
jgi:hypothetical protein